MVFILVLLRGGASGGFDLLDTSDRRVEGEQRRGMPGLVIAHRLQDRDIGPFAARRGAIFLEHGAHLVAQRAQFRCTRSDDMTGHDGRRRLTERTGLHVLGEIDDLPIRHDKIDDDCRTAEFRMGFRSGSRRREPPLPRNIARQIEDPVII
jgi:hypothetical protein